MTMSMKGPSRFFFVPANNAVNANFTARSFLAMASPLSTNVTLMAHITFGQNWPLRTTVERCCRRVAKVLQKGSIRYIPKDRNRPSVASLHPI